MKRILVVDDEDDLRDFLTEALQEQGYSVIQARNGREAFRVFKSNRVDLVITDIYMPEEDGLGLMRLLRTVAPRVRIIAMSGGGSSVGMDFLPKARELGAMSILPKPIAVADLWATVKTVLTMPCGQKL